MSSGPCSALVSLIRAQRPTEIGTSRPSRLPASQPHLGRQTGRRHGGTGIGADRDIAVLWCDIAPPCASPPTAPPTERRTPARNPRFSTCSGLVFVRHGLSPLVGGVSSEPVSELGFSGPGDSGPIPKRLWMIAEA